MTELVSTRQLYAALLRWALVLVPGFLLLGYLSEAMVGLAGEGGAAGLWFASLVKPAFCPSAGVIALVWNIGYALIALALAVAIEAKGARGRGAAIAALVVLFALSLAWVPLFFGMHRIGWALGLLLGSAVLALATMLFAIRVRGTAAAFLLPYVLWLMFMGFLTWYILAANPAMDGISGGAAVVRMQIGS